MRRIRSTSLGRWLDDAAIEIRGQHRVTQNIKAAVQGGDKEAATAFRSGTGTLRAALTTKGRETRGAEIADYTAGVIAADGTSSRMHRTLAD